MSKNYSEASFAATKQDKAGAIKSMLDFDVVTTLGVSLHLMWSLQLKW
jgi:hypothetical protein